MSRSVKRIPACRSMTATEECEARAVVPLGYAPGRAQSRGCRERLNLDEERSGALECGGDDRSRHPLATILQQPRRRVLDALEPTPGHGVEGELGDGAETVLAGPEHPEIVSRFALKGEHDIHQVLEKFGPGDVALLGHVPDQDHRDRAGLGEVLKPGRHLANLAHRAGDRIEVLAGLGLDRVHHDELRRAVLESAPSPHRRRFRARA